MMGDSATMTDFFPSKRRRIDHASTRPSPSPCVLDRVHAALKPSYQPSTVPCRDKEKAQLTSFLQRCLSSSTAGSLYVCGAPGCGKSLLISNVLSEVKQWCKESKLPSPYVANLNLMSVGDPKTLYSRMALELGIRINVAKPMAKQLEEAVTSTGGGGRKRRCKMMVVVLDEVDAFIDRNISSLYKLFELPHLQGSKVVLLSIANAIDMTDRFLPLLRAHNCHPESLVFHPYDPSQLSDIVANRINAVLPPPLDGFKVFDPKALMLMARRVAGKSGDVRLVLQLCQEALAQQQCGCRSGKSEEAGLVAQAGGKQRKKEVREEEAQAGGSEDGELSTFSGIELFGDFDNDEESLSDTEASLDGQSPLAIDPKKCHWQGYLVSLPVMLKTLSRAYASPAEAALKALPLQASALYCATTAILSENRRCVPKTTLETHFNKACKEYLISHPSFSQTLTSLVHCGILKVNKGSVSLANP